MIGRRTHGRSDGRADGLIDVLHVDDDADFLDLAATFLDREDDRLRVQTATTVESALEQLEAADGAVDCVVSDYDMPDLNGIEFLERVREARPDVPFILFTGKGSEEIASEAISAGVSDYLQKERGTKQYAVLANRIRNLVDQARASRQLERSQRELKETTKTLEAVFEASPVPIVSIDPGGQVRVWNAAATELFGWTPSEVSGNQNPIVPEDRMDEFRDLRERVLEGKAVRGVRIQRRARGGEELDLFLSAAPVTDPDGTVSGIVAVFTEVPERERVLESLHEATRDLVRAETAEEICERAVEAASEVLDMEVTGCWLHDEDESVLRPVATTEQGREVAAEMPVYREGEGLSWAAFEAGETRVYGDVWTEPDRYVEETAIRSEIILPLGRYGVLNIASTTPDAFDDRDVSFAEVLAANTEAALARADREERLREEQAFTEAALNALDDLFYVFDADGTPRRWNDRVGEVTGYTDEEIADMAPTDFFADDEEVAEALEDLWGSGHAKAELELVTKDGEQIPYEVTGSVLTGPDHGDLGFVGIARDITERTRRERELTRQNERLEEFTRIVSHDLRNPLSVATGRVDLAAEECDTDHLAAASRALERMEMLIDNLLTLAKEGDRSLDAVQVGLAAAARHAWENVPTDSATLHVETDATVRADEGRLQQLLENLVRNAVEHGGDDVTVTVRTLGGGFFVEDDGRGIPPDAREQVFEPGYTTTEAGTGFGLGIVRQVADAHGWTVAVTENDAGGARFEFTDVEFVEA